MNSKEASTVIVGPVLVPIRVNLIVQEPNQNRAAIIIKNTTQIKLHFVFIIGGLGKTLESVISHAIILPKTEQLQKTNMQIEYSGTRFANP